MLRLRDRNPAPHFWEWVWTYNLPIVICEGAKKAATLLSAGYVAIALPGVWNLPDSGVIGLLSDVTTLTANRRAM